MLRNTVLIILCYYFNFFLITFYIKKIEIKNLNIGRTLNCTRSLILKFIFIVFRKNKF